MTKGMAGANIARKVHVPSLMAARSGVARQAPRRAEHLGLALALNVPVFIVITKIDMCPPNVLQVRRGCRQNMHPVAPLTQDLRGALARSGSRRARQETIKQVTKILKSPGCRKVPVFMQTMDDVLDGVATFVTDKYGAVAKR